MKTITLCCLLSTASMIYAMEQENKIAVVDVSYAVTKHNEWYFHKYPLHVAAQNNDIEKASELLSKGYLVNQPDDFFKETPLMKAAEIGRLEMVYFLLKNKANPDIVDTESQTALHKAADQDHKDVILLLVGAGAEIDKVDSQGYNPAMKAIYKWCDESAQILINLGAKVPDQFLKSMNERQERIKNHKKSMM